MTKVSFVEEIYKEFICSGGWSTPAEIYNGEIFGIKLTINKTIITFK